MTAMTATARTAVVTGGGRGLGRSAALALAARGADVILTYRGRREDALATVAELERMGRRAAALPLEVGDTAAFPAFADAVQGRLRAWGRERFEVLVNNAGHGVYAPFAETTEAQFDELLAVHLKGVFFLTQRLLPVLADGGRIVNLSTGLARFSIPGYAAYAAAKGAVEVLTRYLAKELGPRGIAVNAIAPGAIATDFGGGVVRDDPRLNAHLASQTALGRVGVAEDVGALVAALAGEEGRWVNGQRIEVSGGMML